MAKERAPRRRRRWFLLALLVGAVTWYVRSRSAAGRMQLATSPPLPEAPRPAPVLTPEPDAASEPDALSAPVVPPAPPAPAAPRPAPPVAMAPATLAAPQAEVASEVETPEVAAPEVPTQAEAVPAVEVPVVTPAVVAYEAEAPVPTQAHPAATGSAQDQPADLEPADSAFDIGSAPVVEPAAAEPPVAEALTAEPPVAEPTAAAPDVAEPVSAADVAAEAKAADAAPPASPSPRPRPRPRRGGAAGTQVETPPAGSAPVADSTGEETPSSGFGPTSATVAPAPEHALFTPASTDGVGAGAVPNPEGEAPGPEFTIKGHAASMLFHTPDSPHYEQTRAEVWFRTADEAVAAGFTPWREQQRTG
ncbi:MAG TPA: hypothetical protein VGE11_10195 [Pseudonocardia sp.]